MTRLSGKFCIQIVMTVGVLSVLEFKILLFLKYDVQKITKTDIDIKWLLVTTSSCTWMWKELWSKCFHLDWKSYCQKNLSIQSQKNICVTNPKQILSSITVLFLMGGFGYIGGQQQSWHFSTFHFLFQTVINVWCDTCLIKPSPAWTIRKMPVLATAFLREKHRRNRVNCFLYACMKVWTYYVIIYGGQQVASTSLSAL